MNIDALERRQLLTSYTADPSFGEDGSTSPIGGSVLAIRELPDHKLLIGGASGATPKIARLNPDGSLDKSFAVNGVGAGPHIDYIFSGAVQADQKVILDGFTDEDGALTRFNADGTVD